MWTLNMSNSARQISRAKIVGLSVNEKLLCLGSDVDIGGETQLHVKS